MTNLHIRSISPLVLESPFEELRQITPNSHFYVRNHFPIPEVTAKNWSLTLEGNVAKTMQLSYEDILRMPSVTREVLLECAGNSRIFLTPPPAGVQWQSGGVSNATWKGVLLSTVLNSASINPDTVELIFEGADSGEPEAATRPEGAIKFARSISMEKALKDDVLLAYEMNGENLSPEHGYPLRLIVPGWYAVASVKWLERIVATIKPFHGYFQTVEYSYWDRSDGYPVKKPITELLIKSQIAKPEAYEQVAADSEYTIYGAAWSSSNKITRVEISTDNAKTWKEAALDEDRGAYAWRLWSCKWKTPAKECNVVLSARATDEKGNVQSSSHDKDRTSYMINHSIPIEVTVCNR